MTQLVDEKTVGLPYSLHLCFGTRNNQYTAEPRYNGLDGTSHLVILSLNVNKPGYTATEVACGWVGAIFEVTRPFGQEQRGQKDKIIKKVKRDQPTNQPTDGQSGL